MVTYRQSEEGLRYLICNAILLDLNNLYLRVSGPLGWNLYGNLHPIGPGRIQDIGGFPGNISGIYHLDFGGNTVTMCTYRACGDESTRSTNSYSAGLRSL